MSQFKNNTLIINKLNTSLNMFQMSDKKPKLIMFHNKELNNMLIINQSKNQSLELLQPFNNHKSNNQLDNQLLLEQLNLIHKLSNKEDMFNNLDLFNNQFNKDIHNLLMSHNKM
jgi:hypothetical protein